MTQSGYGGSGGQAHRCSQTNAQMPEALQPNTVHCILLRRMLVTGWVAVAQLGPGCVDCLAPTRDGFVPHAPTHVTTILILNVAQSSVQGFVSLTNTAPCGGTAAAVYFPACFPTASCSHRSRTDSSVVVVHPRVGTAVKSTVIDAVALSCGLCMTTAAPPSAVGRIQTWGMTDPW